MTARKGPTGPTRFMELAAADFEDTTGTVALPFRAGSLTVRWRLASTAALAKAARLFPDNEARQNAVIVRDHISDEDGAPVVPRDEEGTDFLLRKLRPTFLARLARLVAGATEEEAKND